MGYNRKRRMSYTHTPDWVVWQYPQQYQVLFARSVFPIPAVAVIYFVKAQLKWKGTGDLSPSAAGLIPGGVTVLKNTRDVVAQTGGEPAVPGMIPGGVASHPIPGRDSSNPQRGAGCSWDDSRW